MRLERKEIDDLEEYTESIVYYLKTYQFKNALSQANQILQVIRSYQRRSADGKAKG